MDKQLQPSNVWDEITYLFKNFIRYASCHSSEGDFIGNDQYTLINLQMDLLHPSMDT